MTIQDLVEAKSEALFLPEMLRMCFLRRWRQSWKHFLIAQAWCVWINRIWKLPSANPPRYDRSQLRSWSCFMLRPLRPAPAVILASRPSSPMFASPLHSTCDVRWASRRPEGTAGPGEFRGRYPLLSGVEYPFLRRGSGAKGKKVVGLGSRGRCLRGRLARERSCGTGETCPTCGETGPTTINQRHLALKIPSRESRPEVIPPNLKRDSSKFHAWLKGRESAVRGSPALKPADRALRSDCKVSHHKDQHRFPSAESKVLSGDEGDIACFTRASE